MPPKLTIVAGPPQSGKTQRLLDRYRRVLAGNNPGAVLWLAPTWRAAAEVRWRLLTAGAAGCFSPGVMTFEKFAEAVIQAAPAVVRPMTGLMKRHLIRQLIDEQLDAGRLEHFRPIARTGGLVDLVSEFISELKRLEIWPEEFQRVCNSRGMTQKDVELLEIYTAYQQCLQEHQLYDAEGRFWSARDWLSAKPQAARLVVADGFTDFTRTQHEIIEILAARADELFVSLTLEPQPRRTDLFTKPLATLAELRRRHENVVFEELPRGGLSRFSHSENGTVPFLKSWPAMAHIEKTLFANPRRVQPAESTDGVEIIAAAGPVGEIEQIGSRIKLLIVKDGAPPGDIAVVFRSTQHLGALVAEVFGRLGIPFAIEAATALDRSPVLKAFVAMLRMDVADRQFDDLPERATLSEWAEAWRRLAADTGLLRIIEQEEQPASCVGLPDRLAWQRLMGALTVGETLFGWLQRRPPQLDRREALAALVDILASEHVGAGGDESGQVRVLSASGVRALQIPHLFMAGLSEKAFPPPDREDRLYTEAECQRLIDEGLPLVARTERNREEMLLFYETLTRASRRLYLSYPAMDDSAQPLSPSPYLAEVEQACGPGRIRRSEFSDLSPIPAGDEPLCRREFRIKAVATALEGNVSLLAGLVKCSGRACTARWGNMAENIIAGLHITHMRSLRDGFSPAEGILTSDASGKRLAEMFGLERTFSATRLEQYASCPFRFFMEYVLKLEPVEELALQVDFLQRGRLAHEVLASFHRRVNQELGRPASPSELDSEQFDRLMGEVLDERFGNQQIGPVEDALLEVDRRLLARWMSDYCDQHKRYDELWRKQDVTLRPEFFEVSFGRHTDDESPPSANRPLEFTVEGQTVRISGRIDRIDTGNAAGNAVFNVIDYKTGDTKKVTPEGVAAGTMLQLPVYALAVAELLLKNRRAVPWQAGYWSVSKKGFPPKAALQMHTPEWEEIRSTLPETIVELVRGIRGGRFPVCSADKDCTGYCPFSTVCRINQVRSLEKSAKAPALRAGAIV